jgi:hypothetical protein
VVAEMNCLKIIWNYVFNETKNVAESPTACIFFILHLIVLIIALVQKESIYTGDLKSEPTLFYFLAIINLPSMIIACILLFPFVLVFYIVSSPFITPHFNYGDSYEPTLSVLFFYTVWQIQWALIGYWIELLWKKSRIKEAKE